MAQPPQGIAGTQTYLIESNRANSKIDADTPDGQNSRWTTQTDFQLKRGDRVSVEMAVIEAGISNQNQTIEFTKQQVKGKGYADNKVVFEFGFYVSNNSRYNTLAPFRVKHEYGGGVWGAAGNMQCCPINSPQYPPLQQHIPAASLGFSHSQGQQYDFFYAIDTAGNAETTINQPAWTGGSKTGKIKYIVISQLSQSIPATMAMNGRYNRTVSDFYPPVVPLCQYTMGLTSTPLVPVDKNGWNMEGNSFEIVVGMGVSIEAATGNNQPAGSDPISQRRCLGVVSNILSGSDNVPAIVTARANLSGIGVNIAGNLIIELREEYTVVPTDQFFLHSGIIGYTKLGGWSANKGQADSDATPFCDPTEGAEVSSWDRIAKGGMNIGMQNWSAGLVKPKKSGSPNPVSDFNLASGDINAEPAPTSVHYAQKLLQTNLMRKLGGGIGWEVMRTATDELLMKPQECSAPITNKVSSSSEGIQTMNMMNYKDNDPYILVCPSFQGTQVNPNGTDFCPELKPMTAFIIVSANETFEDVSFLAERITNAFHAVNPFANTTGKGQSQREKRNNCLPYYHEGWFPTYWDNCHLPPTPNPNPIPQPPVAPSFIAPNIDTNVKPFGGKQQALFSGVAPLWSGNLVKCIPANCTLGANLSEQAGTPYYWTPSTETDYLSSGGADTEAKYRGTTLWWKGIFGNMGVRNLAKYQAGDMLNKRAETWCLNNFTANPNTNELWNRNDCGRIVLLNTQVPRVRVTARSPDKTFATLVPDPAYPDGFPYAFNGAVIQKGQALLTNMYYNEINIKLLAEVFKLNEKYDVTASDAVDGYEAQQAQPWNWYYEFDIGQSDSSKQVRDKFGFIQAHRNTDYSQGASEVINTNFVNGNIQVPQYLLDVVNGWWVEETPPMSKCLPHPSSFQSSRIISGQAINSGTPSDVNNEINVSNAATNNRSMISPSQCTVGNGFSTSYQEAKQTGIIRVHSRWWNELDTNPALPDFTLEEGNNADLIGCVPSMRNQAKKSGDWLIDPELSRETACGGLPYIYNTRDGYEANRLSEKHFICFMAFKSYNPVNNNTDTWELNQWGWGDFFGFSPSPYDNPVLIPTNSDAMNLTGKINFQQQAPAPALPVTTIDADPKQRWNRNNYIWCGAGDAVCEFDAVANRFKIGGLYTENRLPKLDISGNAIAATPQIGEQEIILGANTESSTQDIWELMENSFPLSGIAGGVTPLPVAYSSNGFPVTTWFGNGGVETGLDPRVGDDPRETFNRKDQNINDVQTGVFLHKVWLAPENWTPPEGVDLQNYYDPRVDMVEDPTCNMGNAPTNVGGATNVNGTTTIDRTKQNRNLIIADLIEASLDNWEGCLLDKMGFNYFDLLPPYGEQNNRFSEFTYGRTDIATMYKGTKPLIQNTQADSAANISMGVYTPALPADTQGTPLFSQGFLNNSTINIGGLNVGNISASRFPTLFSCPFYSIVSNIVQTQFQSSDQTQNVIWLGAKNYGAGQYYYISASDFAQVVDQDRLLTEVTTEIRNPNTGRLAQLSPNSAIVYKIQRDIIVPIPEIGVDGQDMFAPPVQQGERVSQHLHENLGDYSPEELREMSREEVKVTTRVLTEGGNAVERNAPRYMIDALESEGDRLLKQSMEVTRAEIESSFRGEEYIMDKPELMKGIYKLAVEKALQNMRVIDSGRQMLNPFIMAREINNEWAKLGERVTLIDARQESISPEAILRELRTDDVVLGSQGQIVKRRGRPRGKRRGELAGRYNFEPQLYNQIAEEISKESGNLVGRLRTTLQSAIDNREITYKAPEGQGGAIDTESLYAKREAGREAARAAEQERRDAKLGGTRQQRSQASLMARRVVKDRMDGAGYSDAEITAELRRELEFARANPVAYMRNIVGKSDSGGGGDPDAPPPRPVGRRDDSAAAMAEDRREFEIRQERERAEERAAEEAYARNRKPVKSAAKTSRAERLRRLNAMQDERDQEKSRGKIVKKKDEK